MRQRYYMTRLLPRSQWLTMTCFTTRISVVTAEVDINATVNNDLIRDSIDAD
jgi:hypothetical protein